jgi:hypothetical protein
MARGAHTPVATPAITVGEVGAGDGVGTIPYGTLAPVSARTTIRPGTRA